MSQQPDSATRAMTNDECQMDHSRQPLSGFTITEIVVVVVLVGVLLYLITPHCDCGSEKTRLTAAKADIMGGFKTALDRYKAEVGSYPHTLQDLVTRPADIANWTGPFVDRLVTDPWDNPYIYVFPGRHNPNSYDLYSMGRDGQDGTADDIGNWTKAQ